MRIKTLIKPHFVFALLVLLGFFGYVAYVDLIFDGAAIAEEKIEAKMTQSGYADGNQRTPEYYGLKRAEIALGEYRKNIVEQPIGCNCGPEVDKYTGGTPVQWCALFASWVGHEAGSGVTNAKTGSWRIVNSRDFATYLEENGTWYSREEIIEKGIEPQLGDFVIFWRGNFEDNLGHVDVVVDLSETPGSAGMVGGNLRDRVDYRSNFPYLQNYGFLGFGRPEKQD